MTDAELVRRARDGHVTALEQLATRWAGRVLAICRARIGRASVSEDLAQEVLLRGFQRLNTLNDPRKFGAWLRGIAVRVCCDWLRDECQHHPSTSSSTQNVLDAIDGRDTPPQHVEHAENRERLLTAVDALPEELRETVLLYYFDDVTYLDLAELLGVSRATVNTRLAKARTLLARHMSYLVR